MCLNERVCTDWRGARAVEISGKTITFDQKRDIIVLSLLLAGKGLAEMGLSVLTMGG